MPQQINLFSSLSRLPWYYVTERLLLQVVGGFMGFLLLVTFFQIAYLQKEKYDFKKLHQSYQATLNVFTTSTRQTGQVNVDVILQEIQDKTLLLQTLQNRKVTSGECTLLSSYLTSLSESSVPGLWLNQINVNLINDNITLSGMTYAPVLLIQLVQNLNKTPCFANREFGPLKFTQQDADKTKQHALLRFSVLSGFDKASEKSK